MQGRALGIGRLQRGEGEKRLLCPSVSESGGETCFVIEGSFAIAELAVVWERR